MNTLLKQTVVINTNRSKIYAPYSEELGRFLLSLKPGQETSTDIKILRRYFNIDFPDGEFYLGFTYG